MFSIAELSCCHQGLIPSFCISRRQEKLICDGTVPNRDMLMPCGTFLKLRRIMGRGPITRLKHGTEVSRRSKRHTMKISGRPSPILRENNLCMTLQLRKVWRGRGGMPPAKKRKYVDCVTRLQNLANSFDEDSTDILEYLSEWIIIYNFKSILVLNF